MKISQIQAFELHRLLKLYVENRYEGIDRDDVQMAEAIVDDIDRQIKNASVSRESEDKSFTAHDDAVSDGCISCGNEWMSLNREGRCSHCQQIWDS